MITNCTKLVLAPFADSLRKLSLRKTMIAGKQPVLPSKKKPISSKTRNPYAHIKSKVGKFIHNTQYLYASLHVIYY